MKILDLFCGAGGAGEGYRSSGHVVTGVDSAPMPYPGPFVQHDALTYLRDCGRDYDMVHASPPCQGYSALTAGTNRIRGVEYPTLIEATRVELLASGLPFVIENVPGKHVRRDLMLCGTMFDLRILMHRWFEIHGFMIPEPDHPRHQGRVRGYRHGEWHDGPYIQAHGEGGGKADLDTIRYVKEVHWAETRQQLNDALPVEYTRYIGRNLRG